MQKYLIFISAIFIFTIISCGTFQSVSTYEEYRDADEFGTCYAICLSPKISKYKEISYASYTGDDKNILENHIEDIQSVTKPAKTKWVKKKADRNCLSADPNDCLVWCLVEIPAEYKTIGTRLIDTTITDQFTIENTTIERTPSNGGKKVKMAVICNPSPEFIQVVQSRLTSMGYDLSADVLKGSFGEVSENALVNFQNYNELHTGGFTLETMDFLDVDY